MSKKTDTVLDLGELDRQTKPVRIGGKDFVLVELDGTGRDKYQEFIGKRVKFEKGVYAGTTSFEGMRTYLISLTLRDSAGKAVPQTTLDTWPSRITEKLFEESRVLSGLGEEAEAAKKDEAKNG